MKTNNKINITRLKTYLSFFLLMLVMACSNEVDFGELYKKTVYIVNSNNLLYVAEHFFEKDNDAIAISVYCASSKPITQDLQVRLKIDRHALDSLNALELLANPAFINRVMLPEGSYQIDGEQYVTIKAGEQYGILNIPFDFDKLDPTIPYALPVTVVSNNADYEINNNLKSIVYQIEMVNAFSGSYSGSSQTSPTTIVGVQPTLKAISWNTVRMPIHNLSAEVSDLLTNFMLLTIADDNSVSISPWGISDVTDLGGSTYDPVTQTYELNYQFVDASAVRQTVTTIIKNINAPVTDEDEL